MLSLDAIRLRAGRANAPILDGVSLDVAAETTTALLGPSGAGKSSLLRVIMGLAKPEAGIVRHENRVLTDARAILVPPALRGFGYLFQDFSLFPHLNVRANILIGVSNLDREAKQARVDELAGMLDIEALLGRAVHDLSGGEQQRVALARTLAPRPRILLLDEPFSNLDRHAKYDLWHEVRRILRERGITALIATHDQEEAFFFSDRIAVMRNGRVLLEDTPRGLYETPRTPWLARFTGKAHCLTGREIQHTFANASELDPDQTYLVRPEHIVAEAVDESTSTDADGQRVQDETARVTDLEYYGWHSLITIQVGDRRPLQSVHTGPTPCEVGQAVRLRLNQQPVILSTS